MTVGFGAMVEGPALLTDLYQLTMAYGYWKLGRADRLAAFHLSFRSHPFAGGYTVAAGLGPAIDYLHAFRFHGDDLDYLASLTGADDSPLFSADFLDALGDLRLTCDIDAVPEGTVVFPHEPLVRVVGPIWQAQLLETALLNLVNFSTLVATKAARVCDAAGGDAVIEFGLRRAQGVDGGLTAARAAYIGGCVGTSNVLAGRLFGIPVKGTHAHSWVMSFDDEREAFDAYARVLPNNCIFLVDTYDTLEGVRRAAHVARRMRDRGAALIGIRLDSGDLTYLSIEARKILDEAGLSDAVILASNDLDEHLITSLKAEGARIDVWGVGTKLVTAYDQPALGGVYKLAAIRGDDGRWEPKLKLSEQIVKVSTPGLLRVRRYVDRDRFIADAIYDEAMGIPEPATVVHPGDPTRRKTLPSGTSHEELLVPIMRGGEFVYAPPPLDACRERARAQIAMLHPTIRRLTNPHAYPAGLERGLHDLKADLVMRARAAAARGQETTP